MIESSSENPSANRGGGNFEKDLNEHRETCLQIAMLMEESHGIQKWENPKRALTRIEIVLTLYERYRVL